MSERITSFAEFWRFYVAEHRDILNRRLHFVGTTLGLLLGLTALLTQRWWLLALTPLAGYGFAWVGHFLVERNRPAAFRQPLYSLMADFVMYGKIWTGAMDEEVRRLCDERAAA
jgi:hypothetical protein